MPFVQLLLPSVLLISQLSAQEPANLARKYAADEKGSYVFSLSAELPEGSIQAKGTVAYKVTKLMEGGKAEVHLDLKDVKAEANGNELPNNFGPLVTVMDATGLQQTFPHENAEVLYSLLAYCSIAPGKPLKPGETMVLDWANEHKSATVKGKVKLLEMVELDGVKAAKLSHEVTATSDQDEKPLFVNVTSWIEISNGRLIKAEGTAGIEEILIKLSIKRGA